MATIRIPQSSQRILGIWRQFSTDLTGKPVSIRIYRDYNEWKVCFLRVTGMHARMGGSACLSLRNGRHTIHIYVPESFRLEERFRLFLHELGHIHLDHFGKAEGSYLDKESEADAWVALNFSRELNVIDRLVHWRSYGKESYSDSDRPVISGDIMEQVRQDIGDWFIVNDKDKSALSNWINECEEEINEYVEGVDNKRLMS